MPMADASPALDAAPKARTIVKICGIRTPVALEAAIEAGADMFGLVFYPRSPRNVSIAEAAQLISLAAGRAQSVALFVDPDDATLDAVMAEAAPDIIQLHGEESPERTAEIAARTGRPIIKALRVADAADAAAAVRFDGVASHILFDAKPTQADDNPLPGGNGVPFDWRALLHVKDQRPFMLSGGLTPENVRMALALTGASGVDVSSGVESAPGQKDPALIRAFVAASRV